MKRDSILLHTQCGVVERAPSNSHSPCHVLWAGIRRLCHARTHCWVTYLMLTGECWNTQQTLVCVIGDSDAPQGGPPAGGRHPHPQCQDDWGWQAGADMCHHLQQIRVRAHVRMCVCVSLSVCVCFLIWSLCQATSCCICMTLGLQVSTVNPNCSCMAHTTTHHTMSLMYTCLPDTGHQLRRLTCKIYSKKFLLCMRDMQSAFCVSMKSCLTWPNWTCVASHWQLDRVMRLLYIIYVTLFVIHMFRCNIKYYDHNKIGMKFGAVLVNIMNIAKYVREYYRLYFFVIYVITCLCAGYGSQGRSACSGAEEQWG